MQIQPGDGEDESKVENDISPENSLSKSQIKLAEGKMVALT
jgi:hypothetical protein